MLGVTESPIDHTVRDLAQRVELLFPGFPGPPEQLEEEDARLRLIEEQHRGVRDAAVTEEARRMHTSMHLVVANQILAGNPRESWETLQRIVSKGYTRHDAVHMVAAGMSDVFAAIVKGQPQSPEVYLRYLAGLPEQSVRKAPAQTSRTSAGPAPKSNKRR